MPARVVLHLMDAHTQHQRLGTLAAGNTALQPLQDRALHDNKPLSQDGASLPQYKLRYILSGHTRSTSSLKFSPDGTMLASAGISAPFF